MRPARRRALIRAIAATGQVTFVGVLAGGVVWAAGQPAVQERIDGLDLARETSAATVAGPATVALERAVLGCPGPELLGLAGARELPLQTGVVAVAAPLGELSEVLEPEGVGVLEIAAPAASDGTSADGDTAEESAEDAGVLTVALEAPTAHLAIGSGAAAPALVATQETRADSDEVAGLASVPCQVAGPQAWLVGGGGGPGRAERLVLTNPGSNPVTVDITAYGAAGVASPPGGQGVVVPAQGRTVLLGDALAPEEDSPAFAVTATGGDVAVALVETAIEGTRPVGFDVVAPTAPPSEEQVVAGVLVPEEGQGSVTTRIVNPGKDEVVATISALTATGELPLPQSVARVPAGGVADVPVVGVPAGTTSLAVRSDGAVVAAVRTVVDDGSVDGGADAGWAVSQVPFVDLVDLAGAAVPAGAGLHRVLVLASTGAGASVEVTQGSAAAAATSTILVPTDATVVVPVTSDGIWVRQIDGDGALVGAVLTTDVDAGPAAVSSMPLTVPPTSARRSEVVPLP